MLRVLIAAHLQPSTCFTRPRTFGVFGRAIVVAIVNALPASAGSLLLI